MSGPTSRTFTLVKKMLEITEIERSAYKRYIEAEEKLKELKGDSSVDLVEVHKLEQELDDIEENEDFWSYRFKSLILGAVERKFHMPTHVLPRLFEEILGVADSKDLARMGTAVHKTILWALDTLASEDVAATSAKVVAVHYKALIDAGVPEELARSVVMMKMQSTAPINSITTLATSIIQGFSIGIGNQLQNED
jgi:hypothetical protein